MLSEDTLLEPDNPHAKMNDAYAQLRNELFCEESCLIYDSISSHEHDKRFDHLPEIAEIKANIPNPHGYATGMEDSMLNAGFAIEMCINRAMVEPDNAGEYKDFAQRLVRGMRRCSNVCGHKGYVVRSVSHRDLSSCYMESSRDQFTLFVYGLWRYFHSTFASQDEKAEIAKELCAVADFAESRMRPEYAFNLGRLDGYPGVNLRMLEVQSHEAMRLPMFFAAASDVSGDDRYRNLYLKYVDKALDDSAKMHERRRPWWHIELSQMQISLSLCRAVENSPSRLTCINELMQHIAAISETQISDYHLPRLSEYRDSWSPLAHAWRDSEHFTIKLNSDDNSALFGGKLYLKGEEKQEFKEAFDRIRGPGNMATAILLATDYCCAKGFWSRFAAGIAIPDYRRHTSGGLVNILCAYSMALQHGLL